MLWFQMIGDYERGQMAQSLLRVREVRQESYPSEIFDEFAWNMLLHLFVTTSNNEVMTENRMIDMSGASMAVGRRWLAHLLADGQISDRGDGQDVSFTPDSVARMRAFLDRARNIHREAVQVTG
jgi:hypothetical protein